MDFCLALSCRWSRLKPYQKKWRRILTGRNERGVVILGYQPKLAEFVEPRADSPVQIVRSQHLYPVTETVGYVPTHEWGTGAPISAMVTENLIAAGAEGVVLLGGAAGLQNRGRPRRREDTDHHFRDRRTRSHPGVGVTERLHRDGPVAKDRRHRRAHSNVSASTGSASSRYASINSSAHDRMASFSLSIDSPPVGRSFIRRTTWSVTNRLHGMWPS